MSPLGTAVLAAIGINYLNAKFRFTRDLRLISGVARERVRATRWLKPDRLCHIFVLEEHSRNYPDKLALVYTRPIENGFEIVRYTYKQLYETILKYAAVLRNVHKVGAGDTVALCCMNSDEYVLVWMAIWSLGAIPAFINYNLRDKALIHCVRTAGASVILVDDELNSFTPDILDALSSDSNPTRAVFMDDGFRNQVRTASGYRSPDGTINHQPSDTAVLIFTSGTTGFPKPGIVSWYRAMLTGIFAKVVDIRREDTVYTAMPLYHGTAALLAVLPCFFLGATIAVGHKFWGSTFWKQVHLCDATVIQYVGEACRYLVNAPPNPLEKTHKVRMAYGNGLRPDVWVQLKDRFNIALVCEFYAATDFPGTSYNIQHGDFGIGAINNTGLLGKLIKGPIRTKVAVLDPDDPTELYRDPVTGFGRECKIGEAGEFICKVMTKTINDTFQGYKGNKEATEKKVIRDLFSKGDIWIRSGDAVKRSEDGLVYFVDRMGDTYRWKSENVSTSEVENTIHDYDGVQHVAVVGIKVPNHEGRAGFAVIQADKKVDLTELARYLLDELPRYAVPVFIKFTDNIDMTGNNKTSKVQYRNQVIPDPNETIYRLKEDNYVAITRDDWNNIAGGKARI